MSKWYSIRAKSIAPRAAAGDGAPAVKAAEIFIFGDIGESWWEDTVTARELVRDLAAIDADEITVRINSVGGSVPDGIAIYNALKRHPATIITANEGMALSIASLIMMAGDRVEMAENAMYMMHAPWTYASGNSVQLREMADYLDTWAAAMSASYAAKSGMDQAAVLALLTDGADHYYTAAEAKAAGFVDEVVSALPIAAHADMQSALNRFRTLPAALRQQLTPAASAAAPAAQSTNLEQSTMGTPTPQAAAQPDAAQTESLVAKAAAAAAAEALAKDQARREGIATGFKPFAAHSGVADLMAQCQNDHTVTVEAANHRLLTLLGQSASPVGHVQTLEDETDKRAQAAAQALIVRAGLAGPTGAFADMAKDIRANPFNGQKLLDMARASAERAGVNTAGMDQRAIVAAAFTQTSSDFPILLENTMHKVLQGAYAVQALTWRRFCATGSVSDFRAHNRYRLGSFGNLDALNEVGEYKNKSIPDGEKASITASTKGNVINLSRQAIINDDIGAFIGLANSLGSAAARTVESDVYALLAQNAGLGPTMLDGNTLFHAAHGNITTGAALSVASIDLDRVAMATQKDVSGNDYLDLRPDVLLVAIGLGGAARVINQAQYDPDSGANKMPLMPNKVLGLFRDIVDSPRLSGTRRYLFADPSVAPVIEVAFLDGVQEPYLESEVGFSVDGTRWKVRLDYGVGAVDYRGAVTNAGA